MYLNKALLIGNLTRDPELKSLPSGVKVASFSIATNRTYTDGQGQRQEQTDYHNIVVFGRQAETTAQYLKKGSMALIEGRIQTRSWEQDGQKRYRTEVVADRVQFGPKGSGGSSSSSKSNDGGSDNKSNSKSKEIDYPESTINPDDIPF
jgi:single-strand DNA-binding protein